MIKEAPATVGALLKGDSMDNKEAIEILKEELHHTEFHLNDKYKAPEFYEEMGKYCEAVKMAIKSLKDKFTRDELENWLYAIAINNTDNDLGKNCEEIIKRLDGFERYVEFIRSEHDGT